MSGQIEELKRILRRAGEKIMGIYDREYDIRQKENNTPVTEADFIANKIILEGLRKYGIPVLSEEGKDNLKRLDENKIWIVDPLDGTMDFIEKTGDFALMIGLVISGEARIGAVYLPFYEKMYFAERGKGAFVEEKGVLRKIKVSNRRNLNESILVASRHHLSPKAGELIKDLGVKEIIRAGSAGIKIAQIAEGKADIYFTLARSTCQWDTCGPEAVLREARGELTDLKGKRLIYNRRELVNINGFVATNKLIHDQFIGRK